MNHAGIIAANRLIEIFFENGGEGGNRTLDPGVMNAVL
jgi:hypothetical protein